MGGATKGKQDLFRKRLACFFPGEKGRGGGGAKEKTFFV